MFNFITGCSTCVFNTTLVCMGRTDIYGMKIDEVKKLYPFGCDEYEMDIDTYMELELQK